ncbi:MAG TPA: trigger factor [Alphaproteobacteria bacterium]|nr:trigger factor [Alphaproteobacteria bacterium]
MSTVETETKTSGPETPPADTQPPQPADAMNPACRKDVTVEVPADVVSKEWGSVLQQYSKAARVPGFRKGKVPVSVVRNRFGSEIKSDVLESLVPKYFRQAVMSEKLHPVSQPVLSDLQLEEGQPLRFKAAFEVLPEIELGNYRDIKVEKPEVKVTDEDVNTDLKKLQERQASFDPVNDDRVLQDGDYAQVSFQAVPKEEKDEAAEVAKPAQPVQMDEVLVEIGGANTIAEFSANLRGAKSGDERVFDVNYAADFYDKRLAGKTIHYTVKINAIKTKIVPELNDEFAREISKEFETLDALKQRLREGMEEELKHKAAHEAKDKLVDLLVEKHDFPVPNALVERQIDLRLERGLRALAAQGMKTEDMRRMDFARLRAAQRESAVKEVKSNLLLEKIADAENIQVGDQDLEKEIAVLAQQMNQTPEALRQRLVEDGAVERIRSRMRSEKALDFLYNQPA